MVRGHSSDDPRSLGGAVKLVEGNKDDSYPLASNIMNLCASYQLSRAEKEVLERGLTFIPTPNFFNKLELRKDLHDYHRRIKILDHSSYNQDYLHLPFINPSMWEPENIVSTSTHDLIKHDLTAFTSLKLSRKIHQPVISQKNNAVV